MVARGTLRSSASRHVSGAFGARRAVLVNTATTIVGHLVIVYVPTQLTPSREVRPAHTLTEHLVGKRATDAKAYTPPPLQISTQTGTLLLVDSENLKTRVVVNINLTA